MQIKRLTLIFLIVLFSLNGCSSAPREDIIVVDKSINLKQGTHNSIINNKVVIEKPVKQRNIAKVPLADKKVLDKLNKATEKVHDEKIASKKPQTHIKTKTLPNTQKSNYSWSMPVTGKIIKTFSPTHLGITFNTQLGQAVRAVTSGVVIYSDDKIEKHGKMVIIKHPLGFYSSYTQNRNLRVKRGEQVKQGAIIALTGKTKFYFEMKKFKTPIDPLKYLK